MSLDQSGGLQDLEVVGEQVRRSAQPVGQLGGGRVAHRQEIHDPQARGIGERGVHPRSSLYVRDSLNFHCLKFD
ncbi:hypothetical protein GCM10027062_02010 [Nocardioides hungaricus]